MINNNDNLIFNDKNNFYKLKILLNESQKYEYDILYKEFNVYSKNKLVEFPKYLNHFCRRWKTIKSKYISYLDRMSYAHILTYISNERFFSVKMIVNYYRNIFYDDELFTNKIYNIYDYPLFMLL
jgi:hypothetical protein